jgi:hypothetical protein
MGIVGRGHGYICTHGSLYARFAPSVRPPPGAARRDLRAGGHLFKFAVIFGFLLANTRERGASTVQEKKHLEKKYIMLAVMLE